MKTIHFNGNEVELYDSLQEASIERLQMYNVNFLLDAGIGSNLDAFDQRMANITALIGRDPEGAKREIINLQLAVRFLMGNINPEMNSFCCLIHKLNGRRIEVEDLTDEGMIQIRKELSQKGLSLAKVRNFLSHVKKKFDTEYETFLDRVPGGSEVKEIYSQIQRRGILVCRQMIKPSPEIEAQLEKINEYFIQQIKPKVYHGPRGMEARFVNRFEDLCIIVAQNHAAQDPRNLKALAFYRAVDIIDKQIKQRNKKK